jgi:hypothetical protein
MKTEKNIRSCFTIQIIDCLCGLVIRIPGCRSKGPRFDTRRYQIFWEVVGLEQGLLSLVTKTQELFGNNSSGSGLENREYGRRDSLRWPHDNLYPQKLALTSLTRGGWSVCIVLLRTKAMELSFPFTTQIITLSMYLTKIHNKLIYDMFKELLWSLPQKCCTTWLNIYQSASNFDSSFRQRLNRA